MYLFVGNCVILVLRPTPPSFIKGARVAAPSVCFAAARTLLAAAPTAPPCFRHWRRSSPLHIISASGLTDSTRTASPTKRKAPGELQLLGGFSFGEANGTSHDSISSICDSLQKSSTPQKIYNCALRPTCYLAKWANIDVISCKIALCHCGNLVNSWHSDPTLPKGAECQVGKLAKYNVSILLNSHIATYSTAVSLTSAGSAGGAHCPAASRPARCGSRPAALPGTPAGCGAHRPAEQ